MVILFCSEPESRPTVEVFSSRDDALDALAKRWDGWFDFGTLMVERNGEPIRVESEISSTSSPESELSTETLTFETYLGGERREYSAALIEVEDQ